MSPLDLRGLLAALHDGQVRFVLIGGVAVGAHGYVRATEDVDIVPDPSPENVRRLGNALVDMDATLRWLSAANASRWKPAKERSTSFSERRAFRDSPNSIARPWRQTCWVFRSGCVLSLT